MRNHTIRLLSLGVQLPHQFFDDFVTVAADECRHFLLLEQRLEAVGSHYGGFQLASPLFFSLACWSRGWVGSHYGAPN